MLTIIFAVKAKLNLWCNIDNDIFSVKKLSPRDVKLRLNPWMNPEILKLIRTRDRLFARRKREPDNDLSVVR